MLPTGARAGVVQQTGRGAPVWVVRPLLNTCAFGQPLSDAQGNEQLAIPHVRVPDMRWVDWKAIKAAGFEGAAFDKDNTLTLPFLEEVWLRCATTPSSPYILIIEYNRLSYNVLCRPTVTPATAYMFSQQTDGTWWMRSEVRQGVTGHPPACV